MKHDQSIVDFGGIKPVKDNRLVEQAAWIVAQVENVAMRRSSSSA
jgi:hypothetical protein